MNFEEFRDQLEISLPKVIDRQLYVTAFGQEIYTASLTILEEAQKVEQSALAYQRQIVGKMTISIVSTAKYIMPLIGIRNALDRGDLQIIPIKGMPIASSWNLIWLKKKRFLPPAQAFLTYVKQNKEAIIKDHFSGYDRS